MANPNDPNLDIKVKVSGTPAAVQDLDKTKKGLEDVTKASTKANVETEKLTKTSKAHGVEVEKVVGVKGRLLDSFKKLTGQIPGLGFAIGALKNPFVALIAVIALLLDSLAKIKAHIEAVKAAVGDGKITTNFETIGKILAQGKIDAKALADELDRIASRDPTIDEAGQKAIADFDRQLRREELADPEGTGKETRAQRRLEFIAGTKASQALRAREDLRAGRAAIPAETAALQAARDKHRRAMELAEAHTTPLKPLEDTVAQFETILNTPLAMRSYAQLQLTSGFHGERGLQEALAIAKEDLANAQRGNTNVGILRANADADLADAERRFSNFSSGLTTFAGQARSFGESFRSASADADVARPASTFDPTVQARYEAQFAAFLERVTKLTAKYDAELKRQANGD